MIAWATVFWQAVNSARFSVYIFQTDLSGNPISCIGTWSWSRFQLTRLGWYVMRSSATTCLWKFIQTLFQTSMNACRQERKIWFTVYNSLQATWPSRWVIQFKQCTHVQNWQKHVYSCWDMSRLQYKQLIHIWCRDYCYAPLKMIKHMQLLVCNCHECFQMLLSEDILQ